MARPTVPGPWKIQRESGITTCENPHPVRLPRRGAAASRADCFERQDAVRRGAPGYLCPGGMEHGYPVWIVYRDLSGPAAHESEMCDRYLDAVAICDERNGEEAG